MKAVLYLLLSSLTLVRTSHPLLEFIAASAAYNTQGAIYTDNLVRDEQEFEKYYDFIIVGGGNAGCVLANRLSENPNHSVLLIEAGRDESYVMNVPILMPYLQATSVNWNYRAMRQPGACLGMVNKRCRLPRGKVLGGSSGINAMVYTRGNRKDFDRWNELGNYGWSYNEIMEYYIRVEKLLIPELMDSPLRGHNGPIPITNPPFRTPLADSFLKAGQNFGYDIVDFNSGFQTGFNYLQATMINGTRCSANRAYIMPIRNRKNLFVTKYSMATKILINPINNHAYGVQFIKNRKLYTVFSKKEIILSAGVFGTPQILMLSGIGPSEHLQSLNIPVIQDLKVGYNLQDHIELGAVVTFTIEPNITIVSNRVYDDYSYNTYDYVYNGKGPYTSPAALEALGFINTRLNKESFDYPDIELQLFASGLAGDGVLQSVSGINDEIYQTVFKPLERKDTFTLLPLLLRPESKGRIKLNSKNPFKHPSIYMNYLSEEIDIEVMLEATKFGIQLALSDEFKKYGTKLHDIPIPACKHLQFNSDDYWRCAFRQITLTNFHQCCTAKMGPKWDTDAVVDPELRVYGVRGLRVIDASIMPKIPSAHIMATVYAIAEKGSDMIINTWRHE